MPAEKLNLFQEPLKTIAIIVFFIYFIIYPLTRIINFILNYIRGFRYGYQNEIPVRITWSNEVILSLIFISLLLGYFLFNSKIDLEYL